MILTTVLGDPVLSLNQRLLRGKPGFNWSTWHIFPNLFEPWGVVVFSFLKRLQLSHFDLLLLHSLIAKAISNLFSRSFCRNTNWSCDKGYESSASTFAGLGSTFAAEWLVTSLSYAVMRIMSDYRSSAVLWSKPGDHMRDLTRIRSYTSELNLESRGRIH